MRKLAVLSGLLVFGSLLAVAQSDEASLRDAMKKIGPTNGGVGKKIAAKDATAADDAKKLLGWYTDLKPFFAGKKMDDGVQSLTTGIEIYGNVAKLVADAKWDEAAAEQKKIGSTCMGCHSVHREKLADGSYKLK